MRRLNNFPIWFWLFCAASLFAVGFVLGRVSHPVFSERIVLAIGGTKNRGCEGVWGSGMSDLRHFSHTADGSYRMDCGARFQFSPTVFGQCVCESD